MRTRLSEFKTYVRIKASSFARRPADVDDFYQEGILAAWQALSDDPEATKSYVHQRITWRMIDHAKRRLYKNPADISADEDYSNELYSDYSMED